MECWYDMQCHLATQDWRSEHTAVTEPGEKHWAEERERESMYVCECGICTDGDSEYIKDIAASRWETRWVSRDKEEVTSYLLDLLERRKAHHYRSWFLARAWLRGHAPAPSQLSGLWERVCVYVFVRERKREEPRAGELTQHCLTPETVSSTNNPTAP